MDGLPSVVGEASAGVVISGRPDADHVGQVVRTGIESGVLVKRHIGHLFAVVSSRCNKQYAALHLRVYGVGQCLRKAAAAPGIVGRNDIDAAILHRGNVVETGNGVGEETRSGRVEEFARQNFDVPGDAGDADPVVAHRAYDPGHVRPVTVVVHGIGVSVDGIDAVTIVDMAVAVVVDAVVVAVGRVLKDVRRKILVVVVDTGVDHRNDDVVAPRRDIPGLGGVDIRVDGETGLAGVVEPHLAGKAGIVRNRIDADDVVGLDVCHIRMLEVGGHRLMCLHPERKLHVMQARDRSISACGSE